MAHQQQQAYCSRIRTLFPQFFDRVRVLDYGSGDVNGNNRWLFTSDVAYLGVDVAIAPNVNLVSPMAKVPLPDESFDVIISTEALEHDPYWAESLANCYRLLRKGGLMLLTAATTGRLEHGTRTSCPDNSFATAKGVSGFDPDYYRNLTRDDLEGFVRDHPFTTYDIETQMAAHDIYFYGIK